VPEASRPQSLPVFLVGPRATGKTTVARLLAERLRWGWLDADELLERRAGCSIRELFDMAGEGAFRDLESAVLDELCTCRRLVIATGGGVVLRPANRQRLKTAGRIVWLTADAKTLWQRLQGDTTTAERRPNLTPAGGLAEIEEVLRVREPLYREVAEFAVDSGNQSPEAVAALVLARLTENVPPGKAP
jgi:shikimate kinase